MKSKFLTFACIFALILTACACVNAATTVDGTISVSAPEYVKSGENVTVTVTLNPAVKCGDVYIEYNPEVLELVGQPAGLTGFMVSEDEASEAGYMGYSFIGAGETVSTLTYTFKVIGANGAYAGVTVEAKDNNSTDASNNVVKFEAGGADITVGEAPAEDPGTTPENPPADKPADNKPADKEPTKYPQTGVNVAYVACGIALAVVAGYVVVKKH